MSSAGLSFPLNIREFDSDDRISFSRLSNKFIAVHDDGNEYEFDADKKQWTLVEEDENEDEDAHLYREGSSGPSSANVDDGPARERRPENREQNSMDPPPRPNKKLKTLPQPKQNTAVYVTGLPLDATVEEVHDLFSRKAGVIAEEIDSGAPRIKMYNDSEGRFKGDALVVFFKPQSVEMAIMLLDDTYLRFAATGGSRMKIQAADSSYKKTNYDQEGGNGNHASNGNGQKSGEKKPQRNDRDRQKIIKKTQKMDAKLADWDDDDPYILPTATNLKRDKTVILRHMFTLEELEEDPAALLDIKEDIRDECSKLGAVTSVVLYDLEPTGIVSVKFKEVEPAAACVRLMHGRSFDGRTVEASLASGKEKFSKSKEEAQDDSD